jgi:hypothetical protein
LPGELKNWSQSRVLDQRALIPAIGAVVERMTGTGRSQRDPAPYLSAPRPNVERGTPRFSIELAMAQAIAAEPNLRGFCFRSMLIAAPNGAALPEGL